LNVITAKRHYRYRGITAFIITVSSSNTHSATSREEAGGQLSVKVD